MFFYPVLHAVSKVPLASENYVFLAVYVFTSASVRSRYQHFGIGQSPVRYPVSDRNRRTQGRGVSVYRGHPPRLGYNGVSDPVRMCSLPSPVVTGHILSVNRHVTAVFFFWFAEESAAPAVPTAEHELLCTSLYRIYVTKSRQSLLCRVTVPRFRVLADTDSAQPPTSTPSQLHRAAIRNRNIFETTSKPPVTVVIKWMSDFIDYSRSIIRRHDTCHPSGKVFYTVSCGSEEGGGATTKLLVVFDVYFTYAVLSLYLCIS